MCQLVHGSNRFDQIVYPERVDFVLSRLSLLGYNNGTQKEESRAKARLESLRQGYVPSALS